MRQSKELQHERQEERLDYLLHAFKEDSVRYKGLDAGESYQEKRQLLRSLMNIRMPGAMSRDVMRVQDEFLAEEAQEKGIITLSDIPTAAEQYGSAHPFAGQISIWQGDITRLKVGAIVNAANAQMLGCFVPCHGCIDNAIHSAAGIELREACSYYMNRKKMQYGSRYEEPTGKAVLTKGYNLPSEYVIHTVGPIVAGELNHKLKDDLRNCYQNVLKCCREHRIRSVAFCCISTGEFHFPKDEASKIAVNTVTEFLKEHKPDFDRIIFNVFKDADRVLYEKRLAPMFN
nr:protein-ADP-ribose hydrolase [uncultured Mediterraneibacter sp.]